MFPALEIWKDMPTIVHLCELFTESELQNHKRTKENMGRKSSNHCCAALAVAAAGVFAQAKGALSISCNVTGGSSPTTRLLVIQTSFCSADSGQYQLRHDTGIL